MQLEELRTKTNSSCNKVTRLVRECIQFKSNQSKMLKCMKYLKDNFDKKGKQR